MLTYCLKFKKNTEKVNSKVIETKKGKTILFWKCAVCNSNKSRFIKKQDAKGLLSSLGLKTPFSSYY